MPGMNSDKLPDINPGEIACQQILTPDHSVFSIQWIVVPEASPQTFPSASLLQRYLRYIERCTLGVVAPVQTTDGIEFRLFASFLPLIKFLPPRQIMSPAGERTILNISGGVLVQQEYARGQIEFIVEETAAGCRVILKLSDYCPLLLGGSPPTLWRKWLYRFTQGLIHKAVTVKFLTMVYRNLTGRAVSGRVVRIAVRNGRDT